MKMPGAIITFEVKGGFNEAVKFMNNLKMCTRAVSLGSADSLISHPASTTHAL
jgi:methionine-gamma-lyase